MNSFFDTERLTADRLQEDHWQPFETMLGNPAVYDRLGGKPDARQRFGYLLKHWQDRGYGTWALHKDSQFVGTITLNTLDLLEREETELAYCLDEPHWNQGYMTEAAKELLAKIPIWELPIDSLVCFTSDDNKPSLRVIAKLGFTFERDFDNHGFPSKLFRYSFI